MLSFLAQHCEYTMLDKNNIGNKSKPCEYHDISSINVQLY